MAQPIPAPSLRELSRPLGVTEGVSSDGCSTPTIYTPVHINSEIFERLRSSKYTPSVSHSLDSSLREGAGMGCVPFNRVLAEIRGFGRFSSPLRNSKVFTFYHSTCRSNGFYNNANSSFFCSSTLGSSSMYCSGNLGLWKRCNAPSGRLTLFMPPPPKERMVCTSSIM